MTPFLGLLLVLLVVFIGVRFVNRTTVQRRPLISGLIVSGIPYILIGVLLGPRVFDFLNTNIIGSLEPLVSLAIGWAGLLFGLQLRWRNVRRFPLNYILFTSTQSLITFFIIFLIMGITLHFLLPFQSNRKWEAVIILAALGSITAPLSIARLVIEKRPKGRLTHLLQFVGSLDGFWGIIIAGFTIAVFHPVVSQDIASKIQWIFLTILIGIAMGLFLRFLIRFRFSPEEIFLIVLGFVIFTSGVGFYLRLSPILLNMIAGVSLAQFRRESDKVMRVIHAAEKPTYLFLLIFAGALWNFQFLREIIFILSFLIARFAGKYIGGWLSAKNIDCAFPIPKNVGKAMLSFGGVSLAIAFNFQLLYGGFLGDFLMSATIIGIFIFDEYSAVTMRTILESRQEI